MESHRIELEHIKLELLHRRTKNAKSLNHLRHFVDQWYCYKFGYITNGNRAAWGKIIFNEYVSEGVIKLLEKYSKEDLLQMKGKVRLIVDKEHIIPLNVITKKLLELPINPSIEEIESILMDHVKYATITKEENSLLSKQDMPSEYFDANHLLYNDFLARYKSAGIRLIKTNISKDF